MRLSGMGRPAVAAERKHVLVSLLLLPLNYVFPFGALNRVKALRPD